MTSLLARPKGWQGGRGLQRHPLPALSHRGPGSLCPRSLGMERAPCPMSPAPSHVPSAQPHPQQMEKRPQEAFLQPVLGEREGMGHPRDTASPTEMALPPLVPHPGAGSALAQREASCRDGGAEPQGIWLSLYPPAHSPTAPHSRAGQREPAKTFAPRWDVMEHNQLTRGGLFPNTETTRTAVIRCLDSAQLLGQPQRVWSRTWLKPRTPLGA